MENEISQARLKTAAAFAQEQFILPEETVSVLKPGTARRNAFDAAEREIKHGLTEPSSGWRRKYSLMLGLERFLTDEPKLKSGTTLNEHQVDALSGTLAQILLGSQTNAALDELEDSEEEGDYEQEEVVDIDEDPNAARRFWFEHATGAGKSVAAVGFVDACKTGGILILTHRRNLVDQFIGELKDHGYADRLCPPLPKDAEAMGPVTVETYQWFVRNFENISASYSVIICDEAHTALGAKTSACIRSFSGPIFIGMTATGKLIARDVADLFPTQTSRFDLAEAAKKGIISPLRVLRIPPGEGVKTIAKVPLRKGEIDMEFDQQMLAELLDQGPFNMAIAALYKDTFKELPGVVYAAGVKHAENLAVAFNALEVPTRAVSGQTPKRELAETLAAYERGEIQVLVNAQLLAEGWNSPRATVCFHLAPTASRRVYQQRVGRVTRRSPGKDAGIVVDFVHPACLNDDPVVTLHSLLDREFYRGGAVAVGPVPKKTRNAVRIDKRVVPLSADDKTRFNTMKNNLWRIDIKALDYQDQIEWARIAGSEIGLERYLQIKNWGLPKEVRRELAASVLARTSLSSKLRSFVLSETFAIGTKEQVSKALSLIPTLDHYDRQYAALACLKAISKSELDNDTKLEIVWEIAEMTRKNHERYAIARWSDSKRLLGLLINSNDGSHGKHLDKLIKGSKDKDDRLRASLLAGALVYQTSALDKLTKARMDYGDANVLAEELAKNFKKKKKAKVDPKIAKDKESLKQIQAVLKELDIDTQDVQDYEKELEQAILEVQKVVNKGFRRVIIDD